MELKASVWFRSLLFFSKMGEVTNEKVLQKYWNSHL